MKSFWRAVFFFGVVMEISHDVLSSPTLAHAMLTALFHFALAYLAIDLLQYFDRLMARSNHGR